MREKKEARKSETSGDAISIYLKHKNSSLYCWQIYTFSVKYQKINKMLQTSG